MSEPRKNVPIIRAVDIEKVYGEDSVPVYALRGVSLMIESGDFMVIAGPSGSGKTTLLNILGSLDTPTKGKVYFQEEDFADKSRGEIASLRLHKIGFVFQAYNLIPVLSAIENIEFTMLLSKVPEKDRRARAMTLLEELGIAELADKRPNAMSGGEQQRVAVARAMVNNPSIIFADEPTANLDSATAGTLLDLMERVNRERNLTFVFSSHDQKVIERARKLLILKDGQIVDAR